MSDVFDEVEEGLRTDSYTSFFKKYGLWLGVGLFLILAGVFGWTQYQNWKVEEAGRYAEKLDAGEKMLAARDYVGAEKYFTDMAKSGPANYKATALTLSASALIFQGDMKTARERLDQAASTANDPIIRGAAKLKAAYLAADLEDYKTLKPRLKELVDGGGPFVYEARELLGAKAREGGDLTEARTQYEFLSTALDAPPGVRNRARAALAVIGPAEESAKPAAASAKPGEAK